MPKFCPECGERLAVIEARFCPSCGCPLQAEAVSIKRAEEKKLIEEEATSSVFELGARLEEVVERIFQARGYDTQRRRRLQGKSGTLSEIDVLASKGNRVIAIECKNYQDPVSIDRVRDFNQKLEDLGLHGVFIAYNGFTEDASEFAEYQRIETWDHSELSEKWLTLSVGRIESRKGQTLAVEYALPTNIGYMKAIQTGLKNGNKIEVVDAELIFHPYFSIEYSFRGQVKDPTKKLHTFKDRDTLFVDALDGRVLNPMPQRGLNAVQKIIRVTISTSSHEENYRNKKLLEELRKNAPVREYTQSIQDDYRVERLKPIVAPRQAVQLGLSFVMKKNTQRITYMPKSKRKSFPEPSFMTYVPSRRNVAILKQDLVVVPRWSIEFEVFGKTYRREVLACSGTLLEDTLGRCPRHLKVGAIRFSSGRSVAVCEVCGESLCEAHVKPCPVCGKWLCEDHGLDCGVCQKRFCVEHISLTCSICGKPLCNECVMVCPICGRRFGRGHHVTCDKCGTMVCPNCITTTGIIHKTRICRKCET